MAETIQQAPLPSPLSRPKAAFNGHTGYFPGGAETQGESSSSAQVSGHATSSPDYPRATPIDIRRSAPVGDWQTEASRIGKCPCFIKSAPTHRGTNIRLPISLCLGTDAKQHSQAAPKQRRACMYADADDDQSILHQRSTLSISSATPRSHHPAHHSHTNYAHSQIPSNNTNSNNRYNPHSTPRISPSWDITRTSRIPPTIRPLCTSLK